MWHYAANPRDPLAETGSSKDHPNLSDVTPERIELIVSEARKLRAQAIADIIKAAIARLVEHLHPSTPSVLGPEKPQTTDETLLEHELKTPLTSMRAAVEILRANAELSLDERNRFLDAAIEDNLRLERRVEKILQELPCSRKKQRWQPPVATRIGFNTLAA